MTGLQKPPKADPPSRVLARFLLLILLLALLAVIVWTAVTAQRIELIESMELGSLERGETVDVAGLSIDIEVGEGGPVPVVLLHDFDVSGRALLSGVAERLGDPFHPVEIDLPGFGLSQRIPEAGDPHTVASMAEVLSIIITDRLDPPVVLAGVGLGGEVAAEVAVSYPDLVRGLVMVDTDFEEDRDWVSIAEGMPYVGRAVVHTFEAGGRFGSERWAPYCDQGGWCPDAEQIAMRDLASSIVGTTDSLAAFLETPESSLVPAELDAIRAPTAYVWSVAGTVPVESVDMIRQGIAGISVVQADVWKAHLESPDSVVEAIEQVAG